MHREKSTKEIIRRTITREVACALLNQTAGETAVKAAAPYERVWNTPIPNFVPDPKLTLPPPLFQLSHDAESSQIPDHILDINCLNPAAPCIAVG